VAQWVGHWTCNQDIAGSTAGEGTAAYQLSASCSHRCVPVTKQYNLIPVNRQWWSADGKVTIGLSLRWSWFTNFCRLEAQWQWARRLCSSGIWHPLPFNQQWQVKALNKLKALLDLILSWRHRTFMGQMPLRSPNWQCQSTQENTQYWHRQRPKSSILHQTLDYWWEGRSIALFMLALWRH